MHKKFWDRKYKIRARKKEVEISTAQTFVIKRDGHCFQYFFFRNVANIDRYKEYSTFDKFENA